MGVFKRGGVWWYRFRWNNVEVRESTKQTNKRAAEQMEAARKTALAKKEVGIRVGTIPTLREFLEKQFLPWVRAEKREKPATVKFYELHSETLLAFKPWADQALDEITNEQLRGFIERRQIEGRQTSTINRSLATLRRALTLAEEWEVIFKKPVKVKLLPGENQRDRTLTADEEKTYLAACLQHSYDVVAAYREAHAAFVDDKRKAPPARPDARLMHDAAVILLDCGLRPEELYRLRWDQIRDGEIKMFTGKGSGSRRPVPMTPRAAAILDARRAEATSEWVFPNGGAAGHINQGILKKHHERVIAKSGLPHFPIYTFRHTCMTRLAPVLQPFVLQRFAGHRDINTTRKYVHLNDADLSDRIRAAQAEVQGGHKSGHSQKQTPGERPETIM